MTRARVVLLGASNLVREPWRVIETSRLVLGVAELEVLGAYGHGRSYGQRSWVLGRNLPGILHCGLWHALDQRPAATTFALLTDIGNDIAYGRDAATIAGWVEESVRRLRVHKAWIVMTSLPINSLERFSDFQIRLARQILFPSSRVTPAEIWREVKDLDQYLRELAVRHDLARVEPELSWYGRVDPIHLRRRRVAEAFATMLSPWRPTGASPQALARPSIRQWLRLRRLLPESWRVFGWEVSGQARVLTLPGSVSVSLF